MYDTDNSAPECSGYYLTVPSHVFIVHVLYTKIPFLKMCTG